VEPAGVSIRGARKLLEAADIAIVRDGKGSGVPRDARRD
jgi:hypothetical protein